MEVNGGKEMVFFCCLYDRFFVMLEKWFVEVSIWSCKEKE